MTTYDTFTLDEIVEYHQIEIALNNLRKYGVGDNDLKDINEKISNNNIINAGVIYLNKEPPNAQETGTWLVIDHKIKKIPNAFNRLIMYDGALEHSPGGTWGETWDDCRLVITIFNTFSNEFKLDS